MILSTLFFAQAQAVGFSLETAYVSSFGPDAYGTLSAQLLAGPDLELGVLWLGGTAPAGLVTGARTFGLGDRLQVRTELRLGMRREQGPTAGLRLTGDLDLDVVHAIVDLDWVGWVGRRVEGGVDAALSDAWTLQPRVQFETWAGPRDPALRVELGVRYRAAGPWWVAVAASGGGRDVLHMGPGATLAVGRVQ